MNESIEGAADAVFSGSIIVLDKTEWQIGVEQQLQALATENNALSAQISILQAAIASQAEVCSQR